MPRIDPLKLLTCLSVLLAPNGGIKSALEVKRLASLMTKFSKKLVSKCIYIQILKCTETELLGQFMTAGGWSLTHMWLTDGILTKNWPLVQELLELLLLCPVDVTRLKSNSAPKLVKGLSKESSHEGVRLLATKLVEQWLKIVKEEATITATTADATSEQPGSSNQSTPPAVVVVDSTPATITTAPPAVVIKPPIAIKPIVMEPAVDVEDDDNEEAEEIEEERNESVAEEELDSDELENELLIKNQRRRKALLRSNSNKLSDSKIVNRKTKASVAARAAAKANNNTETLVYKFTVKDGKKVIVAKVDPATASSKKSETSPTEPLVNSKKNQQQTIIVDSQQLQKNSKTIIVDSQQIQKNKKIAESNSRRTSSDKEQSVPKLKIVKKDQFEELKDSNIVVVNSSNNEKDVEKLNESSSSILNSSNNNNNVVISKKEKALPEKTSSKDKSLSEKDKEKPASGTSKEKTSSTTSKSKEKASSDAEKLKERERKSGSVSSSSSHNQKSSSKSSSSKHVSSNTHRSSSKHSSSDKNRSRDKDRRDKSSKSSSSSSRDKTRDDRDKKKSSKDKEETKKDVPEKDASSLSDQKIADSENVSKLGKIPRKSSRDDKPAEGDDKAEKTSPKLSLKKPSISIEVRSGDKPKTVKTLHHSQFRSHGLTEEAPPPPARKGLKKPSSTPTPGAAIPSTLSLKRSSPPPGDRDTPPEKKLKEDIVAVEKPGAIKLIPAKAKPLLIESDMFMDALSAATNKKDIRKRKRQLSKDEAVVAVAAKVPTSGKKSPPPPETPLTPTSPKVTAAPMKFYQDTLDTSENDISKTDADDSVVSEDAGEGTAEKSEETAAAADEKVGGEDVIKSENDDAALVGEADEELKIDIKIDDPDKLESMKMDIDEAIEEKKKPGPGCGPDGPPGVLCIHRKKGPKKQLKWKPDETLVEIEYFLLDETERVNVTKTFVDARSMERLDERHAMQNRKLPSEDLMEERVAWQPLIIIDNVPALPEGRESREKKIQVERESRVLQSLYFNRSLVPDSAAEPDMELHPKTDPISIPLEDVTGNPDAVNDFTSMVWPEAKGAAPPPVSNNNYQNNNNISNNNMFPPEHAGPIGFVTYDNQQTNWMDAPPPNSMQPHGMPDPMNYNPMMMNMMPPNPHMPPFQMAGPGPQNFAPPNNFQPNNMMPQMPMNMNPNMPPMNMNHGPPMGGMRPNNGPPNNDHDGRGGWFRGGGGGGPGGGGNNDWNNRDGRRDDRGGRNWIRNGRNDRNDRDRGGDRGDRGDRRERGICRQFQNSGFCRLGEKCNFIHVGGGDGGGNRRGRY